MTFEEAMRIATAEYTPAYPDAGGWNFHEYGKPPESPPLERVRDATAARSARVAHRAYCLLRPADAGKWQCWAWDQLQRIPGTAEFRLWQVLRDRGRMEE